MMIAEVTAAQVTNFTPPMEIGAWLACAAFLVWFLLLMDKGISRMRGTTPEPPNNQLAQSVKQLNARMKVLEDWRAELTNKMDDDKNQILAAGEHRAEKLHDRINDVLEAVSELRGTVTELKRKY